MARKPGLSRDAILDKAIELLDRHGIDGLSMRRLGAALGVEAMSLYNHVPSKADLLDGIHERIMLSLEMSPNVRTWQSFVRHQAHALHRALLAHPHAIQLFATRPASTAAAVERLGRYLEVLLHAGFTGTQALSIVQLVAQLVVGHAMWTTSVEVVAIASPTNVGRAAPPKAARRVIDVEVPPQIERALEKWDADRELELGIDAMIAGFERLLG